MAIPIESERTTGLDTTPRFPPIEQHLIDAAARDVRRVLRNMSNEQLYANILPEPPEILVRAERLIDGLSAIGHERAACAWGIHRLVQAGYLAPEVENKQVEVGERWVHDNDSPVGEVFRNLWPDDPLRPKRRIPGQIISQPRWHGAGPVPYEHLLLRSVPELWITPTLSPTSSESSHDGPFTPADILQLLTYRRSIREHKHQIDLQFPQVMSPNEAHAMIQYAMLGSQPGRLTEDAVAKLPFYRRFVKLARREFDSILDETTFRCVLGEIADEIGLPYDDALAMILDELGLLMDRTESAPGAEDAERNANDPADKETPKRRRGRRPAVEVDPKRVQEDMKLYRDWMASNLSKRAFLGLRSIPEEEGLKTLDRGDYHSKKLGNNAGA